MGLGEIMNQLKVRRPIGNFFIKKNLQLRLIAKIVLSVLIATAVFAATLLITYHISHSNAAFYEVSLRSGEAEIGDRLEIVSIIMPSLIISAIVNIIIAFCVGLYASRKYAVPIYKLEQWATLLCDGNLTAKLRFREKEEMRELSEKCNASTKQIRERLLEIKSYAGEPDTSGTEPEALQRIRDVLRTFEMETGPIEVRTNYSAKKDLK
jgi:methyl-accepting chemotaxis protein